MKTIILTATAGEGHNSVARSLDNELKSRGFESAIIDICQINSNWLKDVANGFYNMSINYFPTLYGAAYDSADKKVQETNSAQPRKLAQKTLTGEIKKFIDDFKPDAIIATHVFAANILSDLVLDGFYTGLTVGIITDFTVHPFWEDSEGIDYLVLPHKDLDIQMQRKEIPLEKALHFGIPIHKKFFEHLDKKEMRKKLGLDEDKETVLLMSGSMSHVRVDKALKRIDKLPNDFQVVVFLGKRKTLLKKIEKMKLRHKIKIVGFVSNIEEYYSAADIIITKPGGLTTSECIAKGLPMIVVDPIQGQEARNVEFLTNHQLILASSKTYREVEALNTFMNNDFVRDNILVSLEQNYLEDPAEKLIDFMVKKLEK